jgi:hypothetical protein
MRNVTRAILAGAAYAFALFLVGSAMGVVRVLVLEPRYGALDATVFELPLMLGLAWLLCMSLVRRCAVSAGMGARLLMGAVAFGVLLAGEFGFAALLGRAPDFGTPAVLLGLAGQVAAALLPLGQACLFPRRFRALP